MLEEKNFPEELEISKTLQNIKNFFLLLILFFIFIFLLIDGNVAKQKLKYGFIQTNIRKNFSSFPQVLHKDVENKESKNQKIVFSDTGYKNIEENLEKEIKKTEKQKNLFGNNGFSGNLAVTKKILSFTNSGNAVSIEKLRKIYEKNKNIETLQALVQILNDEFEFDESLKYYTDWIGKKGYTNLNIDLYLKTVFNSSLLSVTDQESIKNLAYEIDKLQYLGLLSVDQKLFYLALIDERNLDFNSAEKKLSQIKTPVFKKYYLGYLEMKKTYQRYQDSPKSFFYGLLALLNYRREYYKLAKKLAVTSCLKDEKNVLGYQILGYIDFLYGNYSKSIENFRKLLDLDFDNSAVYLFLIGIADYWNGNYKDSVVYLRQAKNIVENSKIYSNLKLDILRYLILNYEKLGDNNSLALVRENLLQQTGLQVYDFYNFFNKALWQPYFSGYNSRILNYKPLLFPNYLKKCYSLFGNNPVCVLGDAIWEMKEKNYFIAEKMLDQLEKNYKSPIILKGLIKVYEKLGNSQKQEIYKLKLQAINEK